MNMLEESDRLLKGWTIEILATDLNDRSVETAKAGIYGDYALRNTTDYYKRKYFSTVDEKKLQVRPEVKKLITFSRLNLQDDSKMLFMKGMDLVFCCNVLIYFDGASKSKVINHFFSNLNFGGYFFLGTSESLMKLNDKFHLVHFPGNDRVLETIPQEWQAMTTSFAATIRDRVERIETMPAIPAVFLPLLKLLSRFRGGSEGGRSGAAGVL